MNRILSLAAAVDERPTLEETDEMLAELGRLPRDHVASTLIDTLLEYRTLLVSMMAA
ncbi:MAG: hypothetical protein ACQSGP_12530 [Frankia sp.]